VVICHVCIKPKYKWQHIYKYTFRGNVFLMQYFCFLSEISCLLTNSRCGLRHHMQHCCIAKLHYSIQKYHFEDICHYILVSSMLCNTNGIFNIMDIWNVNHITHILNEIRYVYNTSFMFSKHNKNLWHTLHLYHNSFLSYSNYPFMSA